MWYDDDDNDDECLRSKGRMAHVDKWQVKLCDPSNTCHSLSALEVVTTMRYTNRRLLTLLTKTKVAVEPQKYRVD